jgi:integrase
LAARRDQDLYDAAAILTAALCGLRRSGLLGRRWRAVPWGQNAILVRCGFTEVGGDRLPKGRRVRSVPAARQVLDLLARVQALQCDRSPTTAFSGPGRHADRRLGALPPLPRVPEGRRRARPALP